MKECKNTTKRLKTPRKKGTEFNQPAQNRGGDGIPIFGQNIYPCPLYVTVCNIKKLLGVEIWWVVTKLLGPKSLWSHIIGVGGLQSWTYNIGTNSQLQENRVFCDFCDSMIFHDILWFSVTFHDILWFSVIFWVSVICVIFRDFPYSMIFWDSVISVIFRDFHDFPWLSMVFLCFSMIFSVIFHDIVIFWVFVIFRDILWYSGFPWFFVIFHIPQYSGFLWFMWYSVFFHGIFCKFPWFSVTFCCFCDFLWFYSIICILGQSFN